MNYLLIVNAGVFLLLLWILLVLQDMRFFLIPSTLKKRSGVTPINVTLPGAVKSSGETIPTAHTYRILVPESFEHQQNSMYADAEYESAPQTDLNFSSNGRGWTGQATPRNISGIDISQFLG